MRSFKTYGILLWALYTPITVGAETLRIGLADHLQQVHLSSSKPFFAQTVSGSVLSLLKEVRISQMSGILINQRDTFEKAVLFIPQPGENLFVNGTPYAGTIRVNADPRSLSVVNIVDIEDYLEGVIPSEMPSDWPLEALKAQAVASRTYALYQAQKNRSKPYDLPASVLGQVYKGEAGFHPRTHEAIVQTRGIVATYEGQWAQTFFHSTSAGHTDDAQAIWGIDRPYLKGVSCPFDQSSPYFRWVREIPLANIERALSGRGVTIATLTPLQYSKAGRVLKLRILHEQGEVFMTGEELRRILGYSVLPSTHFQIDSFGDTVKIRGQGFGHGIGLCQWGARGFAERGFTFDEIVLYYYPGVSLTTD